MRTSTARSTIVLTGVTGGLGSEFLSYLLEKYPTKTIVVLLRAASHSEGEARLRSVQRFVGISDEAMANVRFLCAQITQPHLGVSELCYRELAEDTLAVFHVAANVDFQAEYAISQAANVESTRHVINFCRHAGGARLFHVSTAYVAGKRRGLLRESEINLGQGFWNCYEETKCQAEELLQQAASSLPITVFRPSQIIGDSRTGRIGKLFGYYEFAKLYLSGRMRWLIAEPAVRLDLVPVDYVCQAMLVLADQDQSIGQTYHLVAGCEKSLSIQSICDLMYRHDQEWSLRGSAPVHIVRPAEAKRLLEEEVRYRNSPIYILSKTYESYLIYERTFEVSRTHQLLEAGGVVVPDIAATLQTTTKRLTLGAKTMVHAVGAAS